MHFFLKVFVPSLFLINEIKRLDRSVEVYIDTKTKSVSTKMLPLQENTVDIGAKEGIELLDRWYEKWTSLIHGLICRGESVKVDLSGGFDTRIVLTLFLHPDIDLAKIRIQSNTDNLYSHSEDFKIASQIAEKFGFSLNTDPQSKVDYSNNTMEEIFNISFNNQLGFHKEMHWKQHSADHRGFYFSGA